MYYGDIKRGDVFIIKRKNRVTGTMIAYDRPAIIVSNDKCNKHAQFVEVVFVTSKKREYPLPTHIDIICKVPSVALCEQIQSINKDEIADFVKSLTDEEMAAVDKGLRISLGMNEPVHEVKEQKAVPDPNESVKVFKDNEFTKAIEEVEEVKFERDMYKKLYEDIIAKLMNKSNNAMLDIVKAFVGVKNV